MTLIAAHALPAGQRDRPRDVESTFVCYEDSWGGHLASPVFYSLSYVVAYECLYFFMHCNVCHVASKKPGGRGRPACVVVCDAFSQFVYDVEHSLGRADVVTL